MSFTWSELENLSLSQIFSIFEQHVPAAKNLVIAHLAGPKPISYLPEEIIHLIFNFLPLKAKLYLGMTCKQYQPHCITATKDYCRQRNTIRPLANYHYLIIKDIISQWPDTELEIALDYIFEHSCEKYVYISSSIYQAAPHRKIWGHSRYDFDFANAQTFTHPLINYDTFGIFLSVYGSKSYIKNLVDAMEILLNSDLTVIEMNTLLKNIGDITFNHTHYSELYNYYSFSKVDKYCHQFYKLSEELHRKQQISVEVS